MNNQPVRSRRRPAEHPPETHQTGPVRSRRATAVATSPPIPDPPERLVEAPVRSRRSPLPDDDRCLGTGRHSYAAENMETGVMVMSYVDSTRADYTLGDLRRERSARGCRIRTVATYSFAGDGKRTLWHDIKPEDSVKWQEHLTWCLSRFPSPPQTSERSKLA